MNLTHILRGAVVLAPAFILAGIARGIWHNVVAESVAFACGVAGGLLFLYAVNRSARPRDRQGEDSRDSDSGLK